MSSSGIQLSRAAFFRGMRDTAVLALFVVPFGAAVGATAVAQDLSATASLVMSALVFAGASQFAALELWVEPLPLVSIAMITLAVNARFLILGAALAPWINQLRGFSWFITCMSLVDANFPYARSRLREQPDIGALLGSGAILWLAWVFGTALGAGAGRLLGSLDVFGMDVLMGGLFMAFVVQDLRQSRRFLPVVVAAVVAVVTRDVLPAGWNVVLAALAGGLSGLIGRAHG